MNYRGSRFIDNTTWEYWQTGDGDTGDGSGKFFRCVPAKTFCPGGKLLDAYYEFSTYDEFLSDLNSNTV